VASNNTAAGRKENRRVQVQLLSNMNGSEAESQAPANSGQSNSPAGQVSSSPVPE
jgi:hypothetical protein